MQTQKEQKNIRRVCRGAKTMKGVEKNTNNNHFKETKNQQDMINKPLA